MKLDYGDVLSCRCGGLPSLRASSSDNSLSTEPVYAAPALACYLKHASCCTLRPFIGFKHGVAAQLR